MKRWELPSLYAALAALSIAPSPATSAKTGDRIDQLRLTFALPFRKMDMPEKQALFHEFAERRSASKGEK